MAMVELKARKREAGNKGHARRLRMQGRIPAVVYGAGEENLPVDLDAASFAQMLRHISSGNAVLNLLLDGGSPAPIHVLIKEVQRDPVNERVLHVDLLHVSRGHKLRVHVPVHVVGTALGVKEGAVLEHLLREIEVECLPEQIPAEVTVDVSALERGRSIYVRDLRIENAHILDSPDRVIVTVVGKSREDEPAPAAAAEGAAAGEGAAKES